MPFTLQQIPNHLSVSVLRVGADHHKLGDPYEGAATVLLDRGSREMIILGFSGKPDKLGLSGFIKSALQPQNNIKRVMWARHCKAKIVLHEVSINNQGEMMDDQKELDIDPFV